MDVGRDGQGWETHGDGAETEDWVRQDTGQGGRAETTVELRTRRTDGAVRAGCQMGDRRALLQSLYSPTAKQQAQLLLLRPQPGAVTFVVVVAKAGP